MWNFHPWSLDFYEKLPKYFRNLLKNIIEYLIKYF